MLLYELKVLNHAHVVFVTVSFVERLQPFARELVAFEAEPDQALLQQIATAFHVDTVLAPWDTANTVFPMATLFVQVVLHCKIVDAYPAVHPTGGDEFFFHGKTPNKKT